MAIAPTANADGVRTMDEAFARMLDADTYPRAFLKRGGLRLEFSDARRVNGRVVAQVEIAPEEPDHG